MIRKLASLALLATMPTIAQSEATPVQMFPPDAIESDSNYRDWYGPQLEQLKEKPLWTNETAISGIETLRFLFIPGAQRIVGRHATVIRIDIAAKNSRILARTEINDRRKRTIRKVSEKSLSEAEVAKLRDLVDTADPWKFRVGTWEEQDGESIAIHCTELIMERRQQSAYAVSHILISCNNPDRLMPLVNYVAELAGQKRKDLRY